RRRHTRFSRDWSSDMCSSDLNPIQRLDRAACAAPLKLILGEDVDDRGRFAVSKTETTGGLGPLLEHSGNNNRLAICLTIDLFGEGGACDQASRKGNDRSSHDATPVKS